MKYVLIIALGLILGGAGYALVAPDPDPVEIADHLIIGGKAYPPGARLAYLSMEYAGDCVLVDSRPTGSGRYWIRLECDK